MAAAPGTPQNLNVQSANQQILVSWDISAGATSYVVQRSLDNVSFSDVATVSGSPLATQYLDSSVLLGIQYWYRVKASNGADSGFTLSQSAIPVPSGEMCLSQIILEAQQRADRVNSNFVTKSEWRNYVNKAMFELYDLLITVYEDYFLAPAIQFVADGTTFMYPLPNGSNTFLNPINGNQVFTPPPFYKLVGVDLALNNATNAYVTVNKFNFMDRNRFVFPNTASTIYGVFNLQYRLMGNTLFFIPTPSAGQALRVWYIPRLKELLLDTDITTTGISGWIEYVIVRAAKYALDKEEADTSKLDSQILYLKGRIEESAMNRDEGQPDTISDVHKGDWLNGWRNGQGGSLGGW